MTENLNQNLYSRFGLTIDIKKVQRGFEAHLKNMMLEYLGPIVHPSMYQNPSDLYKVRSEVLKECCRQLFIDFDNYDGNDYGMEWFIEKQFYDEFRGTFEEYLFKLQIFLNIIYTHKIISYEYNQLITNIEKYISDFPILGIMIKKYKSKSPQILPTTSEKFEQEIKNTLGLLEVDKKYEHALSNFEDGLKEFLTAKNQAQYKNVIEDMYTACDDLAKVILGNKNKGFKHISDKDDAKNLGLNGHQKELFKNLRNWLDEIKHGTIKEFDKNETEMIISMTGSLIRFVILKKEHK